MKELLVVAIIATVVFLIGKQLYFYRKIETKGIETTATIMTSRQISSNDGGSINGIFLITFTNEKNEQEQLKFSETIPQMYASQVQPGNKITIKYLREKGKVKASFIFKKTL